MKDENKTKEQLIDELVELRRRHASETDEEMKKILHNLTERVKELNCLYGVSRLMIKLDISLNEIFQETVNLIPPSWQYPEITCARILFEDMEFTTENFKETKWKQTAEIICSGKKVGTLEVFYLEEKPAIDEGPFLKEERNLIDALGILLGNVTERKQAEKKIKEQQQAMLALSTPVLQIRDQVLILPLIGPIDSTRAARIVEQLLNRIVNTRASIVIVDITGVPVIDTAVANHLIKTIQAAKMLGADTIITGISPENARTLINLGVDFSFMNMEGTLRSGMKLADEMLGIKRHTG